MPRFLAIATRHSPEAGGPGDIDAQGAAVGMADRRRFVFIVGAEGSGTTLLLRLLSRPECCASLGGNYLKLPDTPEAQQLAGELETAHRDLCDRKASFAECEDARRRWQA